jgi:hypothetical protein
VGNHFADNNRSNRASRNERPLNPNSRAAIRARQEAEEREKREWIAQRKREEKAAAEAEAKAKAEWIAQRKRQEREAAEEQRREEQRREEEARRREQERKEAERRRRAEKRAARLKKVVKGVKIAVLALLALVILLGAAAVLIGTKIANSDTNFPNVYLSGIPVGGLTREETEKKLVEAGWADPESARLRVELPMGVTMELDRAEAGLLMSLEDAVDAAYRYGHEGSMLDSVKTYLNARKEKVDVAYTDLEIDHDYVRERAEAAVAEFREKTAGDSYFIDTEEKVLHFVKGAGELDIDQEELIAAVEEAMLSGETLLVYDKIEGEPSMPDFQALYDELNVEPVNARYADKEFNIIPETVGCTFDLETARQLWQDAETMEEILIPLEIVEPEVTEEKLRGELFKDCLGKQTTSFGGSTRARVNNINLAVDKINGTILLPGETFSYNETVGQRTYANGFQEAGAYANGEVVQEVGGGICQVSSTLYCASLYARMTIVDRTSHYFRVTYLPAGQDATVSWTQPDFKFRNDRDYPVKIVAYCDNDAMELTIEIWGTDTDGIWVSLSSETYSVYDKEFPSVHIGWNVYLWISYYDAEGHFLETVEGPASTYFRHDYEIEWPPEKFKDDDDEGGSGGTTGEIIDDGSGSGGGDPGGGGGDDGGGNDGGGNDGGGGGGDDGGGGGGGDEGGSPGDVIIEP